MKNLTMYSLSSEEKANTWTHLVALVAMMIVSVPMIRLAHEAQSAHFAYQMLGTLLYLFGAWLMFGSSTIYHAVTSSELKRKLRILDHIAIYVMIAGSYSPICLSGVGGWIGWSLFAFLWACVIAGVVGKFVALGKHPKLSLALYLAMGWAALLIIVPMWRSLSPAAFWWIIAEGVFYTAGAYFFRLDEEHAYYHAIWHVFINLGAASHTIATWLILSSFLPN